MAAAAIAQLGIAAAQGDGPDVALRHNAVARLVLTHAAPLYDPLPEIFAERQLHGDWIMTQPPLPIAFVAPGRRVTKLLVDEPTLELLSRLLECQASWLASVAPPRGRPPFFYLDPPPGAVRLPLPPSMAELDRSLELAIDRAAPLLVRGG